MAAQGDLVTVLSDGDLKNIESGSDIPHKDSSEAEREHGSINSFDNSFLEKNGIQAALAESDWRVPSSGHEGSYVRLLRQYYFPFYVKFHVHICCAWLAIFVICVIYGPAFLSSTRSNLDLPAGTPSAAAMQAFQTNYPSASRCSNCIQHTQLFRRAVLFLFITVAFFGRCSWAPIFLVQHSLNGQSIVGPYSQQVSQKLGDLVKCAPVPPSGIAPPDLASCFLAHGCCPSRHLCPQTDTSARSTRKRPCSRNRPSAVVRSRAQLCPSRAEQELSRRRVHGGRLLGVHRAAADTAHRQRREPAPIENPILQ